MTAMMKIDLVTAEKGQPMTTSLAIADGVGIAHRAILQLLKNHMSHFEGFGRVAFEMRPFETDGFLNGVCRHERCCGFCN